MPLPDGRVDATSANEVAAVLHAVMTSMGTDGLVDLLARVPGVQIQPGRPGGLLRKATPAQCWLGAEDRLVLSTPLVHEQVVRDVVLHNEALAPGVAPATIARLLVRLTEQMGAHEETSVALTGARDAVAGFS